MLKYTAIFIIILVLSGCAQCTQEETICPDGSEAIKSGWDCSFDCPKWNCDYDDGRKYQGRNAQECATLQIPCDTGESFFDECGCGCQEIEIVCTYDEPGMEYKIKDPSICTHADMDCLAPFKDECGCGCIVEE